MSLWHVLIIKLFVHDIVVIHKHIPFTSPERYARAEDRITCQCHCK